MTRGAEVRPDLPLVFSARSIAGRVEGMYGVKPTGFHPRYSGTPESHG